MGAVQGPNVCLFFSLTNNRVAAISAKVVCTRCHYLLLKSPTDMKPVNELLHSDSPVLKLG